MSNSALPAIVAGGVFVVAFSSEVGTGSREENASDKRVRVQSTREGFEAKIVELTGIDLPPGLTK